MAVNWALGLQQGNAGESFANAFQQGMQQNRERVKQHALPVLVQDPTNAQALDALAKVDPATAMEFRKQQLEYHKAQLAEHSDSILKGAQILREVNPQDQAGYTRALALAQQAGVDISQVPQQYDPQYVQGVVHLADALKPSPQDPGIIREYDEATQRGLVPKGTTYEQYVQLRNPGMMSPVTIPYGAQVTHGGGESAPTTATDAHGNKVQFNPQSGQWEPMGGPSPQGSGGFSR